MPNVFSKQLLILVIALAITCDYYKQDEIKMYLIGKKDELLVFT